MTRQISSSPIGSSLLDDVRSGEVKIVSLTIEQYDYLIDSGRLEEDPSTELIDGFIVKKDRSAVGEPPMTIGDRHRTAVLHLAEMNPKFRKLNCFIQSQQPIWIHGASQSRSRNLSRADNPEIRRH